MILPNAMCDSSHIARHLEINMKDADVSTVHSLTYTLTHSHPHTHTHTQREIMILKQCDSPHIVRYFGTYIKDTDLWISMEYCNAGSVSDLMEAVGITLDEV